MAAPPDLVSFAESAGLAAVAYGPDSREMPEFFRSSWKFRNPLSPLRDAMEHVNQRWAEISTTLTSLADGADLLFTGVPYQEAAANVAEYHGIPLVAWHHVPMRANGHLFPVVPPPLTRSTMKVLDWVQWRMTKKAEDLQRGALGLPKATSPASRRMAERGSLEIQAYDKVFFPALAAEWGERRPIVGALTLQLPTDVDADVVSWISAGTPPIYFGFGSMPVPSPADTVNMIGEACEQLGKRALICAGASGFQDVPCPDHLKVVRGVSHAAIFPACSAVVHHGGVGTTAAGVRAGIPTLILRVASDQAIWAAQVKRLKVGSARRFSTTTRKSLVADLRCILAPQYATRAREIAAHMTTPAASVATTADLLEEKAARQGG